VFFLSFKKCEKLHRKKISKVLKIHRKYNVKGIKKRSIIRQVPLSLQKAQDDDDE